MAIHVDGNTNHTQVSALTELVHACGKVTPTTLQSINDQVSSPVCKPIILTQEEIDLLEQIKSSRAKCQSLGLEV